MSKSDETAAPACFIDPWGANINDVRALAHTAIDSVLRWRSTCACRPASPAIGAPAVSPRIPIDARSEQEILEDLEGLISQSLPTGHPDYVAHMGAVSSTMSPIGDFVTSCLNNNLIALELSPALSALEHQLMREFAIFFGLSEEGGGVITTGGSLSNLHAILAARNAALGSLHEGLSGRSRRPVFLVSHAAHASMAKGAMISGLGSNGAVLVDTDEEGRMDLRSLHSQYQHVVSQGMEPFAVMATAGTTVTGSIDPLLEIHRFARDRNLWFHVDAAWAGALQFSSRLRNRIRGIDLADSITFCPQKLLLVGLSGSMILFRDVQSMARHFRISFPYVTEEEGFTNLCEIGIQGSRPAEVLKLWLTLQHVGQRRYADLIEQWVRLAELVADEVLKRPFLSLLCTPACGIVCFRGTPSWLDEGEWEQWNADLLDAVVADTGIQLTFVPFKGPRWLRAVFANPFVDETFADRLFVAIDKFALSSHRANSGPPAGNSSEHISEDVECSEPFTEDR